MRNNETACVFCGALPAEERIFVGRNGAVCANCLGKAFRAVTGTGATPLGASGLTANRRCLLCDSGPTEWKAVAHRGPFCICGDCLIEQFFSQLVPDRHSTLAFPL